MNIVVWIEINLKYIEHFKEVKNTNDKHINNKVKSKLVEYIIEEMVTSGKNISIRKVD